MHWFKNMVVYRLGSLAHLTVEQFRERLAPQAFSPCSSLELSSSGWVPIVPGYPLTHSLGDNLFLLMKVESKSLPAQVVKKETAIRARALEEQQGFAPGRKQVREIKEQVTDELLAKAFSTDSFIPVWIDQKNSWLVVDASSNTRAELVLKYLLKAIEKFPLETLRTTMSPRAAMTHWLYNDEAPHGFTIDQDTELQAAGESRATVRYVRHTLEVEEMNRHIGAGKQCTRLAMTWNDRVSFVLTDTLAIKSVKPLDVLKEDPDSVAKDSAERMDGELFLMAGETSNMLSDLVEALGGFLVDESVN